MENMDIGSFNKFRYLQTDQDNKTSHNINQYNNITNLYTNPNN